MVNKVILEAGKVIREAVVNKVILEAVVHKVILERQW